MSDNRTKVEQLLKSDTPEVGIELLISLNEPELNQAVSDLIKNAVSNEYFKFKISIFSPTCMEYFIC